MRREFERAKPAIGETLLVRYEGSVQPEGGGNAYQTYSLVLDREATPASWDAIAERYGDRLEDELAPRDVTIPDPPAVCAQCGFAEPNHAKNCPNDIPF